jgi:hypothetical protein
MSSSQNAEAENLETPFFDKHQTRLSDELLKLTTSFAAQTTKRGLLVCSCRHWQAPKQVNMLRMAVHRPPQKILYLAENKLGADNARRTLNLALSNTTGRHCPPEPQVLLLKPRSVGSWSVAVGTGKLRSRYLYLAENKLGADNARRTLNLALSNTTSPSAPFSTY